MSKSLFIIVALDGQSSNHIMNVNILKGLKDFGYSLYGLIVNNYHTQNNMCSESETLFKNYCELNGTCFDYTKKFYYKCLFNSNYWAKKTLKKIDKELSDLIKEREYDRIISFSSPIHSHILANYIVKKFSLDKKVLTQFWSDPICGSLMDYNGTIPLQRRILYSIEHKYLSICSDNVLGTEPLFSFQKKLYTDCELQMRFIDVAATPQNYIKKNNNNIPVVGYFGSFQPSIRNINNLINAVSSLDEKIKLTICGDGKTDYSIIDCNYINIFSKRIPYKEAYRMELETDILVSVGNLHGCQVPGKTLYYAGTTKPVIYILDGQYSDIHREYLKKFNRYIICENKIEDIKKALLIALDDYHTKKKYALPEQMAPSVVAQKLLNM